MMITGYEFFLINYYAPRDLAYWAWRATWDTTEDEDYANGVAS